MNSTRTYQASAFCSWQKLKLRIIIIGARAVGIGPCVRNVAHIVWHALQAATTAGSRAVISDNGENERLASVAVTPSKNRPFLFAGLKRRGEKAAAGACNIVRQRALMMSVVGGSTFVGRRRGGACRE